MTCNDGAVQLVGGVIMAQFYEPRHNYAKFMQGNCNWIWKLNFPDLLFRFEDAFILDFGCVVQ